MISGHFITGRAPALPVAFQMPAPLLYRRGREQCGPLPDALPWRIEHRIGVATGDPDRTMTASIEVRQVAAAPVLHTHVFR